MCQYISKKGRSRFVILRSRSLRISVRRTRSFASAQDDTPELASLSDLKCIGPCGCAFERRSRWLC
jgi:hypothetical protein